MESLGIQLIQIRQKQQLSIDQIVRETHITKQYIEALENENFDVFPGESYLIGFLRKYCRYLEIDPEHMISLYKNTQIQEQPIPVDKLLNRKNNRNILIFTLTILVIGIVSAAVFLILRFLPTVAVAIEQEQELQPFIFSSDIVEQEFSAWTAIEVLTGNTIQTLEIREISLPLNIYFGESLYQLQPDDVEFIDFDSDSSPDLRIVYKSTLNNGNPVLRLDRTVAGSFAIDEEFLINEDEILNRGNTIEPSRIQQIQTFPNVLGEDPFQIEARFNADVLFRYLSETGERVEQFFSSGDRLSLVARDFLYIWISNAGKVQFTVNAQQIRLGQDGSIAAFKLNRNLRNLELIPLY